MENLFVLIRTSAESSPKLEGTPLRLHPYPDREDVQASISWQVKGGWERSLYLVATPIKGKPGFMLTDNGETVEIHNSGWKAEAYADFLYREWES